MGIQIVGLGAGSIDQLPFGIYKKLKEAQEVIYVRTLDHPVIVQLESEGITFKSFDALYEQHDQFEDVYEQIVNKLLKEAIDKHVIYAVPGHPMTAEKTVQLLLNQDEVSVEILGGQSFLDDLFTTLRIDPVEGFQLIDATSLERKQINYRNHLILCQVYDAFVASHVKLMLLEDLPPDYDVSVVTAAGTKDEICITVPLVELDRVLTLSNLTSVYIPPVPDDKLNHTFENLRSIIAHLRSEEGCPWDRKQTHESLRVYAIEEVYELVEAINEEDDEAIVEELGDVLLQVMLHSQIGEDNGYFTVDDVIQTIANKMVHRHPHVFGQSDTDKTWDELKAEEKGHDQVTSVMDVVTPGSPLFVAFQLQKQAAKVGFDWDNVTDVWRKYEEELNEFMTAVKKGSLSEMESELGDVLFVLVNLAKFYNIHPEIALNRTNEKFMARFHHVEKRVKESGMTFDQFTLEQLDHFWNEKKRME